MLLFFSSFSIILIHFFIILDTKLYFIKKHIIKNNIIYIKFLTFYNSFFIILKLIKKIKIKNYLNKK